MAELDNLEIVITSATDTAVKKIEATAAALKKLESAQSGALKKAKEFDKAMKGTSAARREPEHRTVRVKATSNSDDTRAAERETKKAAKAAKELADVVDAANKKSLDISKMFGLTELELAEKKIGAFRSEWLAAMNAGDPKAGKMGDQYSAMLRAFDKRAQWEKTFDNASKQELSMAIGNLPRANATGGAEVSAQRAAVKEIEQSTAAIRQNMDEAFDSSKAQAIAGATKKTAVSNRPIFSDGDIAEDLIRTSSQADLLTMKLDALREKLVAAVSDPGKDTSQIARMVEQIQTLEAQLEKLSATKTGDQWSADMLKNAERIDLLNMKLTTLQAKLQSGIESGATQETLVRLALQIDTVRRQIEKLEKTASKNIFSGIMSGLKRFGGSLSNTFSGLSKAMHSIGRITFYRAVRFGIMAITNAMSVGIQNAYAFSQAVGYRLAPALDGLSSVSLKMQNQVGAAFGSLLMAAAPVLTRIANLAIMAANALTQLFAAFTGGTYLKAKDVTKQFADGMAGGAAAAEEWRNQLLGFDEINRLEAPDTGSGGGGGGGGLDAGDMFEVAEISEKFLRIAEKLKEIFAFLKEHALEIGAAIAGWKIGGTLAEMLTGKFDWKAALGGALTITGITLIFESVKGIIEDGIDWGDVGKSTAGAAGLGLGGLTIGSRIGEALGKKGGGKLGGKIGLGLGGIGLMGESLYSVFTEGLNPENASLGAIGGTMAGTVLKGFKGGLVGAGVSLALDGFVSSLTEGASLKSTAISAVGGAAIGSFFGPWGAVIGAGIGLLWNGFVWIVQNWDEIKEKVKEIWQALQEWFSEKWQAFSEGWTNFWTSVDEKALEIWTTIKTTVSETWQSIVDWFTEKWQAFSDGWTQFWDTVDAKALEIWNAIKTTVTNVWENIQSWFSGKWQSFQQGWSNFWSGLDNKAQQVWNSLKSGWQSIWSTMSNIFTSIINSIVGVFERAINNIINQINNVIAAVNFVGGIFGFSVNTVGQVSLPRFADGGYPTSGSLMIAGEAGAEMVGRINGRTGVASNQEITGIADAVYTVGSQILAAIRERDTETAVYLDGKKISQSVTKAQRQVARATGV